MPLSDDEFAGHAEEAIDALDAAFSRLAARHPVESDLEGTVLKVTFDEPDHSVFVVSPNGPARQIWVSALLQSFKFDWDAEKEAFGLHGTGEPLKDVLERLSQEQLGDPALRL